MDAQQWALLGPAGLPTPALWARWLADPHTRDRFTAKVHRAGPDDCWFWTGAIGADGHGRFRAGSRPAGTSRVVAAHVYAYQLATGLCTQRLLHAGIAVRHACDEASCQNPAHLLLGATADNVSDYHRRRHRRHGPLTDSRGAAGRARAIRSAILGAAEEGEQVQAAIAAAMAAGHLTRYPQLMLVT